MEPTIGGEQYAGESAISLIPRTNGVMFGG